MNGHVAASYLVVRAVFRVAEFFRHWYVDGTRGFWRTFARGARGIEETFAVRLTLKLFFQPLFRDYSIMGHILGPIFRLGRLAVGAMAYVVLFLVIFAAYLCWLALPALLLFYAISAAF